MSVLVSAEKSKDQLIKGNKALADTREQMINDNSQEKMKLEGITNDLKVVDVKAKKAADKKVATFKKIVATENKEAAYYKSKKEATYRELNALEAKKASYNKSKKEAAYRELNALEAKKASYYKSKKEATYRQLNTSEQYKNLYNSTYPYELIDAAPGNTPKGANFEVINTFRVSEDNGSRDGEVSASICADYWSGEVYWILLDTANWWAWGADGWTQHSAGSDACQDWSVSVPAGEYMFILGDAYGDGGGVADVSVNGEYVASVATASGDPLSEYSGLYEAGVTFGVSDASTGGDAIEFSIDMNGTGFPNAGADQCGVNGS